MAPTVMGNEFPRSRRQLDAIDLDVGHCAVREIRERRCDGQCVGLRSCNAGNPKRQSTGTFRNIDCAATGVPS